PAAVRAAARTSGHRRARPAAGRAGEDDRRPRPAVARALRRGGGSGAGGERAVGGTACLGAHVIRAGAAVAALAAAALLLAVDVDVGRWEHARSRPQTVAGRLAENLLGTSDDVELRRAIGA